MNYTLTNTCTRRVHRTEDSVETQHVQECQWEGGLTGHAIG